MTIPKTLQLLTLSMLGSASLSVEATIPEHVPDDFVIQSHRAGGKVGPENTLESCYFAWWLNTIPEADVRTSSDGVIVAFHDKNFERVVANPPMDLSGKGIEDLTFEELRKLDVGEYMGEYFKEQQIPTMESIFEAMEDRPDRKVYLDIKDVSLEALAEMVKGHGVERQVILASTHHDLIQEWKALVPESGTLHWMGGTEESLRKRIEALKKIDFDGITQLQIHARLKPGTESNEMMPSEVFFQELAPELKKRGIVFQSLPWTAETWVYAKLMDLGVESFATDYPQRTRQAISDYSGKDSK